jgi:hypothetical protein
MLAIRSILAVVIAISIALLPVAAGLAVASPSNETVMADRNSMPCCPDCGIQDLSGSTQPLRDPKRAALTDDRHGKCLRPRHSYRSGKGREAFA